MSFIVKEKLVISILVIVSIFLSLSYLIANISDPTDNALVSNAKLKIEKSFIIDKSKSLSASQAYRSDMQRSAQKNIPWSFENQTYWLKIALQNNTKHPYQLMMHFDNPMVDNLTVFEFKNALLFKQEELGWQVTKSSLIERTILQYPLNIKPKHKSEILIKIETTGIAKTPIIIYQNHDFVQLIRSSHLIWGALIGILCMIALYNLVLFYSIKDRVYLIYIGYLLSILALLSVTQGFGHYLFPHPLFKFLRINVISLNFLALAFALLFTLFFLNFNINKEKIYKGCLYYTYLLFALAGLVTFIPESSSAPIFFIAMGGAYFLCFWLLYIRYNTSHFWSTLYFASWLPLLIGGAIQPLELTGVIPYSFLVRNLFTLCIIFEITLMAMALAERIRYQKELTIFNATHDLETNLPNFQALEAHLLQLLNNEHKFTLCLINISGLNRLSPYFNDSQTQSTLDLFIQCSKEHTNNSSSFARLNHLQNNFAKEKIKIARVKENVFAIIIKHKQNHQQVIEKLEPLYNSINDVFNINKINSYFKINISYYIVKEDHNKVSNILKKAFQALETGTRDDIAINGYENHKHNSLTLVEELKTALLNNELMLFHQPQITLENGQVHGSEGLLRWNHKQHGFIPIEGLISLAEDTGLINQISLWVITQACKDIRTLINLGYENHEVSVNISGLDIVNKEFLNDLKEILTTYPIPKHRLNLELTESVMINDYTYLQSVMQGLAQLGIRVSIDDYGTGYSSLAHISQLPFNELKIDKIFIQNIAKSDRNQKIVQTTINMAKILNLRIVAEGIETLEEEQVLHDFNCDFVQGYRYAKPQPMSDYIQWLSEYHH
jgi:EAL domain-containing protein (putative c-di-GMP-specific phosphodiesterase class I)/GGDEF domain-containing protein